MQRLRDYIRFIAWKSGVSYIALWAVTFWTLQHGVAVFGQSGLCHADAARVLFYWDCDPHTPLSILAGICNTALTATVWAPVYIAAATVRPDAILIAAPIVMTHVVGLPTAFLVCIRLGVRIVAMLHRLAGSPAPAEIAPQHDASAYRQGQTISTAKRQIFGLRGNSGV